MTINNAGVVATAAGGFTGNAAVGAGQLTTDTTGNVTVGTGTYTGDITGTATFTDAGVITTDQIGGQTDFAGKAGTVNVNDSGNLGVVTSSNAVNGNLVFLGGGNVNGAISNINTISIKGVAGNIVNFTQNVSAASLTFTNGATANLSGSLGTANNAVAVDFGAGGGVLEFSGTNSAGYLLNSPITNGNTGTLNVYTTGTTLTATDSSIGTVQTINIGQGNAAAAFTVDVSNKALTLESAINLNNTNSIFGLTTSKNQQVTFTNNVDGFVNVGNAGGIVNLSSTSNAPPNKNVLTLQGNVGNETLGTKANPLAVINVSGNVGVVGTNAKLGTNGLDVSNTAVLNIAAGGVFVDASLTSASINAINIGDAKAGPAVYALDAINVDFDLDAPGVAFKNDSSVLKLMTTSTDVNTPSTIYLTGNIDPGAANFGIVELNAENANTTLVINGVKNKGVNPILSLGTANHPLQQIKFSGLGTIEVTAINTKSIDVSVPQLAIGVVNADAFFSGATKLGVVQISGNMDFQNNAGTAIFASDTKNNIPALITGNITSTGGQPNGTVVFMDNGTIGTVGGNNTITNLAMLQAGADNSTVTINSGGNMSITEVQGTGTGNILFTQPTTLTGTITGNGVNLMFTGPSSVSGDIGSSTSKVGDITVSTDLLNCAGGVNAAYVILINGGDIKFNGAINILDISEGSSFFPFALAINPEDSLVIFDDSNAITYSGSIGTKGMVDVVQIDGGDVTIQGTVKTGSVSFTTTQSATLTLANTSVVGGATTTGNKIHTLAITGDLTTGTSPFGSDSNHLKTIQLNSDGKFTIDSQDVYSSVTTKTNNEGTAIFNADNGFTDDLGGENLNLKLVQFSSNKGTVKGDTYAKDITIDAGKSAVFTGYNSRSLDIAAATVGGVKVPRATTKFNYKTKIVSENFKGSSSDSSAEYTNAALVQAPINGGSHKFDDDVWLQKAVTGANVITFAPKKTAFIASNLGANTIVADQATMMFTGDNTKVNVGGNISGSNITFDLGNNQVTYTGSATPTGELIINVFYDTINAGQTGNANSGNIVLASGSTFDLSNVSSIKVFLTAQNNPSAIGEGSAYPVISAAGGSIIVGNAANLPFNVTANEGGFVRWQITGNSFVLLPIEPTGDVTVDNIIGKIIKAPPGSDAAKVANVLVNTPIDQRAAVIKHLLPLIERPSNEIHRVTTPLTPMGPLVGPSVGGGFNPIQPPPTSGSVVNNIYVPPTTPGGYDVTPSNPAGYNTPTTPVTGTGGFGPNGPGTGGNAPSGSVTGGVFTPNGPSVVAPSGPATGGSVGGFGPNGPGTGGTTGGNIGTGGGSPSVGTGGFGPNGPGTGGTTGGNIGTGGGSPSVGTGGASGSNVGTGGTSYNGPASGGSPAGYVPSTSATSGGSVGTGGTSYNGPASTGGVGNSGTTPSGTGSNVGTGSNSPAGGNSVYSPSTGSTRNNVGGYTPSVGQGGTSSNGSVTGGSVGTGGTSYGGAGSNGGVTNGGSSPYGNSGNPTTTSISPANNSNNIGGSSESGMPAIGSSRDNSSGTGSGGNSGSGISRSNANDGFNAAHDNTSTGTQEVGKRLKTLKDAAEDGANPAAEDATSRKRGAAAVGGGDCELDEGNANNSVYGVWVSPYYGKAVQKAFNGLSGYKAKSTGGSIGVDTVINDNIVLGAAYTRVDTKLRYQNAKSGNTTKVGTNMGSIYGLYYFVNNWFVEGVTTYSRSDIKTNELRNIIGGYETAHGKYHSTSYSGQVVGGYNYLWKETSFAPMAGLRFTKIKDSGYQEYGTSFQNLTIQKRQYNKVEGILGGEIKTTFYKDEFIIRPQVHAFINYDFKGKTPAIIADLNGLNEPLPVPTPKPTKMLYDLGAGVVVKKGRTEYGVHYGLNLAKKYHAQSGTLRLKVNF